MTQRFWTDCSHSGYRKIRLCQRMQKQAMDNTDTPVTEMPQGEMDIKNTPDTESTQEEEVDPKQLVTELLDSGELIPSWLPCPYCVRNDVDCIGDDSCCTANLVIFDNIFHLKEYEIDDGGIDYQAELDRVMKEYKEEKERGDYD